MRHVTARPAVCAAGAVAARLWSGDWLTARTKDEDAEG
jgi:hypothetical protein